MRQSDTDSPFHPLHARQRRIQGRFSAEKATEKPRLAMPLRPSDCFHLETRRLLFGDKDRIETGAEQGEDAENPPRTCPADV